MTEHHDRETVVIRDSGSSLGMILGVVLIVALLVAVWFFTLGPGASKNNGGTEVTTPSLDVPVPSA